MFFLKDVKFEAETLVSVEAMIFNRCGKDFVHKTKTI